jgi:Fe-S-cluster-containing dehydrogenase component
MASVITGPCIDVKDATCVDVCPVNAFFHEDDVPPQWKPVEP